MIKPVRIVNQRKQRFLFRCSSEKVEHPCVHDKRVVVGRGIECEGTPQRRCLALRQPIEMAEHWPQELERSWKRQLRFRFDPARPENAHAIGRRGRVLKQGGLPYPRLSSQYEDAAHTPLRSREQAPDEPSLLVPPDEHIFIVGWFWAPNEGPVSEARLTW
jgi:hypothetical protein